MEYEKAKKNIRVTNSDGMCLLENWVEERAVRHIDFDHNKRVGHKGILTLDCNAKAADQTTIREAYKKPEYPGVSEQGKKKELLMRLLCSEITKEVLKEFYGEEEPVDYRSEMMVHFGGRFRGNPLLEGDDETITPDSVYNEQPVSFWTENQNKITGVSQVKTGDTPFRKNNAFSRPIDEYWNQTLPYDIENYPKM